MKKGLVILLALAMVFTIAACSNNQTVSDENTEIVNAGDPIRVTTLSELEGTSVGQVMVQALIYNCLLYTSSLLFHSITDLII